jgi:hypothetical protein
LFSFCRDKIVLRFYKKIRFSIFTLSLSKDKRPSAKKVFEGRIFSQDSAKIGTKLAQVLG